MTHDEFKPTEEFISFFWRNELAYSSKTIKPQHYSEDSSFHVTLPSGRHLSESLLKEAKTRRVEARLLEEVRQSRGFFKHDELLHPPRFLETAENLTSVLSDTRPAARHSGRREDDREEAELIAQGRDNLAPSLTPLKLLRLTEALLGPWIQSGGPDPSCPLPLGGSPQVTLNNS